MTKPIYLHIHVTIEEKGKEPTRQTFLNYPTFLGWLATNIPEVGDRLVVDVRDPDHDEIAEPDYFTAEYVKEQEDLNDVWGYRPSTWSKKKQ